MKTKKYYIIFLIFVFTQNIISQTKSIDSLLLLLSKPYADSTQIFLKLGKEYYYIHDYNKSIICLSKSLKKYEKININDSITIDNKIFLNNGLGILYSNYMEDYKKALKYYLKALNIVNNNNNVAINRISSLYNNIGVTYADLNNTDKALEFLLKSVSISKDKDIINRSLSNIGELYLIKKDYKNAFKYLDKVINIKEIDETILANTYNSFAKYYINFDSTKIAKNYLNKSIAISKKKSLNKSLRESYFLYSKIYSKQNHIELLKKYNDLYLSLSDSILNKKSLQILSETKIKFDVKSKENKLLKAEKKLELEKIASQKFRIQVLIAGIILIFIFLIIFFIQYRKQIIANKILVKRNIEVVEREKELKLAQIKNNDENNKYINSGLEDEQKQNIINKVYNLMESDKLYLNPDFTLSELAKKINTSRTYVSQVINEHYNCNFKTFINDYRIKEARRLLSDSKNNNITIEAIANKVGFKSKTSFNNAFKKYIGITPSYFLKQQ